jgi:hypothetical protein
MKTLLQNKVKFLILMFLALSLSVYSASGVRSKSVTKNYKHEYRSLKKGVCKGYKQQNYYESNKHRKFQKRINRSNR